jgi:sugar/nucleoside kinase (ribokinase family)
VDELDVLAVGNAIVDVLSHCDESLLDTHGLAKGTMTLVDREQAERIYDTMGPGVEISGGSAANTTVGVAGLGGAAAFVGKVGDDDLGQIFGHDIRAAGVDFSTPPAPPGPATARCLILVTGDAQRTLNTFLGVAAEIGPGDVDEDRVGRARITYLEGYLVGMPSAEEALAKAVATAHAAGRRVALTLSDPAWVSGQRTAFEKLMGEVDVLLANEIEALTLTGAEDVDSAVQALWEHCPVVTVTRSERGAVVAGADEVHSVPAVPVAEVVDTTGAGDLYAAGFLLGLTRGMPLVDCARLGCLAAGEVISHLGARPQRPLRELAAAAGLSPPEA